MSTSALIDDWIAETRRQVELRMRDQQAGHGLDHVWRVWKAARQIQAVEGGDRLIVELAALLHDVGDAKFHQGIERSGEFSNDILFSLGIPTEVIERVVFIVDNISFRKRATSEPLCLEGQIVQDADRLDALGAIGIVRTIEYGAAVGHAFYDFDDSGAPTAIEHFHSKLFKLRELMNTAAARQLAAEREAFMRDFLQQFFREVGQSDH